VNADNSGEEKSTPSENPNVLKIGPLSIDRRIIAATFLFLFISAFLYQNNEYIKRDTLFPSTDSHFFRAMEYYDKFILGKGNYLNEVAFPPATYIISQIYFKIQGPNVESARMSLQIFSVIFLLAMFGVGYELGGYWAGAAVMLLSASSPLALSLSRTYLLDFPQTATFALAFYLLLKTRGYGGRIPCILLGLALTLSFMTKWSTAFFIFVPLVWFLLPQIIRSKKSLLTFALSLAPLLVTSGGIAWFYYHQDMGKRASYWFIFYLGLVLLPMVINAAIMRLLEKRWKDDEDYGKSGIPAIINFAWVTIVFAVTCAPWYLWGAWRIKGKYLGDMRIPRFPVHNYEVILGVLKNMFNFIPILLIVCLIFIFLRRKDIYRLLVLPVGIIGALLIMMRVGLPQERYMFSLLVFAAALSGYWVGRTGWARQAISFILVLVSVISIFSWMFLPLGTSTYNHFQLGPVRLLAAGSPTTDATDFTGVIDKISPRNDNLGKRVIFFNFEDFNLDHEFFMIRALEKGKRIEVLRLWQPHNMSDMEREIKKIESISPLFYPGEINEKLILKIRDSRDPVSSFIRESLSKETRLLVSDYDGSGTVSSNLRDSLLTDLNRILRGNRLYNEERFSAVPITEETRRMSNPAHKGGDLTRMNRLLLQDAFPGVVGKKVVDPDWRPYDEVEEILIMHGKRNPRPVVKAMLKLFPGVSQKSEIFKVGKGLNITLIKIVRN